MKLPRRSFLKSSAALGATLLAHGADAPAPAAQTILPEGSAPAPVPLPHFPDRLHAFVWRNWTLVPLDRIAAVLQATPAQVQALGQAMGLAAPPKVTPLQLKRSYLTVIRRNWHLLSYEQLLQLLDWTPEHMAYILREDDFLYIKLGSFKPKCPPLLYRTPDDEAQKRSREIADLILKSFPAGLARGDDPLFGFLDDLTNPASPAPPSPVLNNAPRFCYSYFALYGDPLLDPENDPYPDGFLQKLAALGVNGVWLQAVLHKLAPFPWISESAAERGQRLKNLRTLVERARRHGIGIYLYLNEPRAMPLAFFKDRPELKGVAETDYAALCTSQPEVREALASAIAHVCRAVPDLAGFFSITASENLTNCWSHGAGAKCPRCKSRASAEVIAEINTVFHEGIARAGSKTTLIAWDWGWPDAAAPEIIRRLPASVALMSVSEWSIPVQRGGIDSVVGEYSISTVGPGPRATKHWDLAGERGMRRLAKIQAGNTWELSATPYIPALENVARHAARLKAAGVDGLMLGWTLGGYPSPNLQTACQIVGSTHATLPIEEQVTRTLNEVARSRFGMELAPAVVQAWRAFSQAFSEFPYHGGVVYNAPMQFGPSNLLWDKPTGFRATMIGFPYDDLDGWRQIYPPNVFIAQFLKIADGFDQAIATLKSAAQNSKASPSHRKALSREIDVASAASIHFRSTASQARFVQLRNQTQTGAKPAENIAGELRALLQSEIALARQLFEIQQRDSRIGFEASNQYYYVPQDLAEKVINCSWLLEHWLPSLG